MAQQQSPWLEGAYGWSFGEGGWNTGMDQNLLKFSFLFDRNVDSIVASLPAAVNGQAHYLTTDNRLYFAVGTIYFSTPVPKWFTVIVRGTGQTHQFNGTSLVQIDNPVQLDSRLDAVELTVASLGTAAFEDVSFFATQSELDVVEANAASYTDVLRSDVADGLNAAKGAALVGFDKSLPYSSGVGSALNSLFTKSARLLFSDDYSVDPTGIVSSSVAINQLFSDAKNMGKIVIIRPGTYLIDAQCNYSGLTVMAHGASFRIDHSAADPTQDVTGFRAIASDSHWSGGLFDIIGTSFTSANAANINGTRQGAFWIGEYSKAGALTRMENISLIDMRFRCTGGFWGLNQVQLTGNLSGVKIDQVHGRADGRAGRLIAFEWGRDTVADKTYHPENIELGVITGDGYRQKFSGCVVFLSGVTGVTGKLIRGNNTAQALRIVAGDYGETIAMPEYAGRVLKAINIEMVSSSGSQWRGLHVTGRGNLGNVASQVEVGELLVSGNGPTTVGGYFEGTSASFAGGETGSYTTVGMKSVYRAFGAISIGLMRVQDFAGYVYYQGISSDADASTNSTGTGHIGVLDAQNVGGPAYFISAGAASFEVCRIDQINAQACSMDGGFTGNLDCFGGYGVADADLTRIVEISIGSGRMGVIGTGAAFGIRSPGGAVRANYHGLKVGNGTVFTSAAVSHGAGGSADKVTHVGCDFVATTPYGGVAAVGILA